MWFRAKNALIGKALAAGADPFLDQKLLLAEIPSPMIIDAGAYVGATVAEYRRCFPKARIFSFEPSAESCARFRANIKNWDNLSLIEKALAETSGYARLYRTHYAPTHSLLPRPVEGKHYFPRNAAARDSVEVACITLDDFMSEEGIDHIDILKLDTQGSESRVLRGAKKTLSDSKISLVFTEVNFVTLYKDGALFHQLASELYQFGFSLYRFYDFEFADDGQLKFGNAIFLSPSLRDIRRTDT